MAQLKKAPPDTWSCAGSGDLQTHVADMEGDCFCPRQGSRLHTSPNVKCLFFSFFPLFWLRSEKVTFFCIFQTTARRGKLSDCLNCHQKPQSMVLQNLSTFVDQYFVYTQCHHKLQSTLLRSCLWSQTFMDRTSSALFLPFSVCNCTWIPTPALPRAHNHLDHGTISPVAPIFGRNLEPYFISS